MPELPEVHTFQQYFEGTSLEQQIADVHIEDGKIIRNIHTDQFVKNLKGKRFLTSVRRGKYLFAQLNDLAHVLFHFGMTGDIKYYSADEDRPKHERFHILFENGFKLGFDCPRKFARIEYISNLETYISDKKLGPDALVMEEDEFMEIAKYKKGTLKGFLMNQHLIAGIGNLYADEICYQVKVHPASKMDRLPKKKLKELYEAMRKILQEAIRKTAYYKDYPEDWFWRWGASVGKSDKGEVETQKIAGRTTYYVKGWQKKY